MVTISDCSHPAELAPLPAGDKVEFGVAVTVRLRGAEKTFRLLGDDEADPAAGLLSFNAPPARARCSAPSRATCSPSPARMTRSKCSPWRSRPERPPGEP